jgi:Tfp pilus assembly major pilin PilA
MLTLNEYAQSAEALRAMQAAIEVMRQEAEKALAQLAQACAQVVEQGRADWARQNLVAAAFCGQPATKPEAEAVIWPTHIETD